MKAPSSVVLLVFAILWVAPTAHAQDEPDLAGSIRLRSQTPWTTPDDPGLRIEVLVRNDGPTAIEEPAVGWTLGDAIEARDQYEAALRNGPSRVAAADTRFLDDALQPREVESVTLELPTDVLDAISPVDSSVYPLLVELRSEEVSIASLRTAAIHIVRDPRARVALSWWTEIDVPIAFQPDGSLRDPAFEEVLAAGDGVVAQVAALVDLVTREPRGEASGPPRFDVVVSPASLEQLELAADGFARLDGTRATAEDAAPRGAAETLRLLRELAASPDVRLHATPFAGPPLPALLASPVLAPDLQDHWRVGNATFERILDEPPDPTVARPPGLALDGETLDALFARGTTTVLGGADSVARPVGELDLAPPPAALVRTATGSSVRILLPDPSTQALLDDAELRRDPVALSQAVLGMFATIWRELPVPEPPAQRGLAIELPPNLPAATWKPLVRRIAGAPFLDAVHAENLPRRIEPGPEPATLEARARGSFSSDYASDLYTTARDVSAFAAMVREPADEAARLERALLYAESAQYLGDETSGRIWIDAVNAVTDPTFDDLAPDTSRVLTFTSRTGRIPLRMGDPGDRVVQVHVVLRSQRVEFLDTGARTVRLDGPGELVTFEAEVKAAGRSTIDVYVYAPSPSGLQLSRSVLVVSSTAINPVALIITVAAGLVLVGLWSRRLFRRRSP